MDDQPNTHAEPVPAIAVVESTEKVRMGNYLAKSRDRVAVAVIDFYREDKPQ